MPLNMQDAAKVLIPKGFDQEGQPLGSVAMLQPDLLRDILAKSNDLSAQEAAKVLLDTLHKQTTAAAKTDPTQKTFGSKGLLIHEMFKEAQAMRTAQPPRTGRLVNTYLFGGYHVMGFIKSDLAELSLRVEHSSFREVKGVSKVVRWEDVEMYARPKMEKHTETERFALRLLPVNPQQLFPIEFGSMRANMIEERESTETTLADGRKVRFDDRADRD